MCIRDRKKAILNKKETAIAQSKQEMIKQEFQDWIWSDPDVYKRQPLQKTVVFLLQKFLMATGL